MTARPAAVGNAPPGSEPGVAPVGGVIWRYVYWKTADAPSAVAALTALLSQDATAERLAMPLCRLRRVGAHAALAEIQQIGVAWNVQTRVEGAPRSDGWVTVMEIYRGPVHSASPGSAAQWEDELESLCRAHLSVWLVGERHVERFVDATPAADAPN